MRIAVIGAAAAAVLGGTLAVTPVTTVNTPAVPGGETCSAKCERLAAVLMPATPKPVPAPQQGASQIVPAANVTPPGVADQPGGTGPSAAQVVPGVASPGVGGGGGVPAVGGTGGMPAVPGVGLGGIPDPYSLAGQVPSLAALGGLGALGAVPSLAMVPLSIAQGVVGVGGSILGIGTGLVGTVETGAIALVYLHSVGLLPNLSLPSFGIPGVSAVTAAATLPAAAAAVPAAAAAIPAVGVPSVGLPAVGLPAAPALPAVPAAPALPALPAAPALPALPAPPALPGPPAIPHPRFCTPHLGPIGACTP